MNAAHPGRRLRVIATLVFVLKRFLAQRMLGLAVVVTLGFTIGVLVAGPVYADASREAILSSEVLTAGVTVENVRFALYANPEFGYASADDDITGALEALPVATVVRQGRGTIRIAGPDAVDGPISLTALFREGAVEHLTYRGEPPAAPNEIALPRSVARMLGVQVGEPLVALGPTDAEAALTLVGTFDPPGADESDFWYDGQSPFPPPDSTALPPALMSRTGYLATIPRLGVTTEHAWDVYLDYDGLTYEDASALPALVRRIDRAIRTGNAELANLQATTGVPTMIELVRQRVADLQVPILLVVFQIGAVTLAVLAGVGALVLTRQSFELAVLRSRGFSRRKLLFAQTVQAALCAIVAFPIGLLIGSALAFLASRSNGPSLPGVLFPIRLSRPAEVLGILAAVIGASALVLLSLPHLRRTILEERQLLSREERPLLARVPVELFVLPVAAFAFFQLRGTHPESTNLRTDLDPLVLLTPTLIIFALSFLSLRLLLFILRRLDRWVGRTKRLPLYLAVRRLGRSPGTSFATSLLLVLSIGLLVVSTSYRAIVIGNHEDSAHQSVGSDWNVRVVPVDQPLARLADLPEKATGVIRLEPSFERVADFALRPIAIAIDPATFGDGGWWRNDYSTTPLAQWLPALEVPDPAVPVDGDAFSVEVRADAAAAGLELVATYETAANEILAASAGVLEEGTATYQASTPGATGLLSITFIAEQIEPPPGPVEIELGGVRVGDTAVSLASWQALRWRGSDAEVRPEADDVTVIVEPGTGRVVGGLAAPMQPIPVLASASIQRSQGTDFEATIGAQRLPFHVVARAAHFPTAVSDFMVVSTPAMLWAAQRVPEPALSLNEIWASGEEDPRPALERAGFVTADTRAAGAIVGVLAQLPQSLAVGMNFAAATGGLGLVIVGVAGGLYFGQRRREFELASLRAMGTPPGQIARVLLLEQGAMIAFAIAIGVGLGVGVLKLVMPYVARSVGSSFPEPTLVLDWRSMGIALAAIVVAASIGLLAALRALARSSVTSVLRGEAE